MDMERYEHVHANEDAHEQDTAHAYVDTHGDTRLQAEIYESSDGMDNGMMTNPMWFTSKTEVHFLFENMRIDSGSGIAIAMVAAIILLLIFEAINFSFIMIHAAAKSRGGGSMTLHGIHSFLKMISVFVGYIIMLFVMTFNVWLMTSAVVGAGLAHLLLRPFLYSCLKDVKRLKPEADVATNAGCARDGGNAEQELLHDYVIENENNNRRGLSNGCSRHQTADSISNTTEIPLIYLRMNHDNSLTHV